LDAKSIGFKKYALIEKLLPEFFRTGVLKKSYKFSLLIF